MVTSVLKEYGQCGRRQTNIPTILAEQVLSLFEQSGSTPREQNAAIDTVRTAVMDRLFPTDCRIEQPPEYMGVYEPFRYNPRGSYCPLSDHEFAESVAVDIYDSASEYSGCTIEVECYTPPYEPPLSLNSARAGGFLVLNLYSETLPYACIGIEFGRLDKENNSRRQTIEGAQWRVDIANPLSSLVYAANFDEAWRIVCQFGEMLPAARVVIRYGG
jgi:hypothetical protein